MNTNHFLPNSRSLNNYRRGTLPLTTTLQPQQPRVKLLCYTAKCTYLSCLISLHLELNKTKTKKEEHDERKQNGGDLNWSFLGTSLFLIVLTLAEKHKVFNWGIIHTCRLCKHGGVACFLTAFQLNELNNMQTIYERLTLFKNESITLSNYTKKLKFEAILNECLFKCC